jgi:hypothetical protein
MSNEGKTHYRRRRNVDLIDLLYCEATNELSPPDINKSILSSIEAQGINEGNTK